MESMKLMKFFSPALHALHGKWSGLRSSRCFRDSGIRLSDFKFTSNAEIEPGARTVNGVGQAYSLPVPAAYQPPVLPLRKVWPASRGTRGW